MISYHLYDCPMYLCFHVSFLFYFTLYNPILYNIVILQNNQVKISLFLVLFRNKYNLIILSAIFFHMKGSLHPLCFL